MSVLTAILRFLGPQLLATVLKAFADYLARRRALADAERLGRAKADADAARVAVDASERMSAVPLPADDDVVTELRKGTA